MVCEFAETHPGVECLCSHCHLSSTLFPRRRDGKIVLPTVASAEDITSTYPAPNDIPRQSQPHDSIVERERFPPPVAPNTLTYQEQTSPNPNVPIQFLTPITSEPVNSFRHSAVEEEACSPPRVGKQARSGVDKNSWKSSKGIDEYTPRNRATSSVANTEMLTSNKSANPYLQPDGIDPPTRNSYPYPEAKGSGSARRTNSKSTRAPGVPVDTSKGTTIRFCPPFVETDRMGIAADSDKGIAWSASCRRQQYVSDDDDFRHHFF